MEKIRAAAIGGGAYESGHSPLVSVIVLAYNNLEYTRQCVESICRYTSHIDYELITVNNGSTDGTEEYLNSLPGAKKLSFPQNIGVDKAYNQGIRAASGKYVAIVSNDIVATARWMDNMLACMEADPRVGMVVPVCNASCNYQQMSAPGGTMDEIQSFAEEWNVSDPCKWEERLKLCTYAALFRKEVLDALGGFDEDFNPGSYDDDAICFSIRRMGYRIILARDTFVHHYGLRSFNEEYVKDPKLMSRNKRLFIAKYGAEPYVAGLIDTNALGLFKYNGGSGIDILGIGSSYGTTPLQVKNTCKWYGGKDIRLYYLSENGACMADLRTICDECRAGPIEEAGKHFGDRRYDYILVESKSGAIRDREAAFSGLYEMLKPGGQLVCTAETPEILDEIDGLFTRLGAKPSGRVKDYYLCYTKP